MTMSFFLMIQMCHQNVFIEILSLTLVVPTGVQNPSQQEQRKCHKMKPSLPTVGKAIGRKGWCTSCDDPGRN